MFARLTDLSVFLNEAAANATAEAAQTQ